MAGMADMHGPPIDRLSPGHYSAQGSVVASWANTPPRATGPDVIEAFRRYIEAGQKRHIRRGLSSDKRPKYGARRLRRLRDRGEA